MNWDDLFRELDLWSEDHRVSTFWWRDDDASEPIPPLVRLLDLAGAFEVEVALAAVPEWTTERLVPELGNRPAIVVQHGFAHRNHAARGERAVECGGARPVSQVIDELRRGRERLEPLFGARFVPILVPPWGRIAEPVLARLPELGYLGLSTHGDGLRREPLSGLTTINAHVDVLTWRGGARFAGDEKVLRGLIGCLRARRSGTVDSGEPIGLLTHHRDHDEAAWEFVETLLHLTSRHPAVRWLGVEQAFGGPFRSAAPSDGIS